METTGIGRETRKLLCDGLQGFNVSKEWILEGIMLRFSFFPTTIAKDTSHYLITLFVMFSSSIVFGMHHECLEGINAFY